jgi:hypothetical protein
MWHGAVVCLPSSTMQVSMTIKPSQVVAALCALLFLLPLFWACGPRSFAGQNDFLQLYGGAKLVGTGDLYSPEAMKRIHIDSTGVWLRGVYYSRLPFYAFVLQPLGWLPYSAAYFCFQIISAIAVAAFLRLYLPECPDLLFFAAACGGILANFAAGQDVTIVLCLAAASLVLARQRRDFLAGLVLAGCAIKFHLFILVPVVVILHRRWRILAGGATGGLAIVALSFVGDGFDWPLRYFGALSNPELHPGAANMPNLHGLLSNAGVESLAIEIAFAAIVLVVVALYSSRSADYEASAAIALAGSLLVSHHAYIQDCSMLLLSFAVLSSKSDAPLLRALSALAVLAPVPLLILMDPPLKAVAPMLVALLVFATAVRAHSLRLFRPLPLPTR